MGGKTSKIIPLPVPIVLQKIGECSIPEDRNLILDLFEMIDINLCNEKDYEINSKQLKESNGMQIMIKIIRKMIQDLDLMYVSIQLFETIKFDTRLVMDFIQFGGLEVLEKALKLHRANEFVALSVPKLLKIYLAIGAPASIIEIQKEAMNLQLCRSCQETLERIKQSQGVQKATKIIIPKSSDRITKVLKFMDNFITRKDVVCASLDAILSFARNADAPKCIHDTPLIDVVYRTMKTHMNSPEVLWRGCLSYAIVASYHPTRAYDIANTGVIDIVIDLYYSFKKNVIATLVQQQILWMLGSLLQWPLSQKVLHKQQKCLDFFKQLIQEFEELKEKFKNDPGAKKKGFKDDKLYEVVLPLQIRSFMRETGGERYREKKHKTMNNQNFKPRRNFDERPKFGTIQERIFTSGEEGLISSNNEDEFGNEIKKVADWELKVDNIAKVALHK